MANNFHKGEFTPANPKKYVGSYPIIYRSSWEMVFMGVMDSNPSVISWSSESLKIPYFNPLKGCQSIYIPDFFITFVDKHGKHRAEMIEIKPSKEVPGANPQGRRVSRDTKLAQALNAAKWQAAMAFCKKRGIFFRVMTERDLFGMPGQTRKA